MAIDAGILDNTDLVAIPLPGEKPYREIGLVAPQHHPGTDLLQDCRAADAAHYPKPAG